MTIGGQTVVAGITSGGSLDSAGWGDESFNTRVDAYQTWIDSIVNSTVTTGFIEYATSGSTYTQDFNTLASTGSSAVLPSGWFIHEPGTATAANGQYTASIGNTTTGDTYSFGAAGIAERSLGGLQSNTFNPTIGAAIVNTTGAALTSITIGYTGEQWRLGATGRADRLDFQYSLNATS